MYDPSKPYIKEIQELIRTTWETPYVSVREGGVVRKKFHWDEYPHTDGIGTKGVYHWKARSFENAVIDALAMNLNDLALMRTFPYEVVPHLFLPEDDHEAAVEIMWHLVEECRKWKIAIPGGETAIHDTSRGLEISITMRGFISN